MITLIDLEEIVDFEKSASSDKYHGAHLECQYDKDSVMLVCGIIANWSEYNTESNLPECSICYNATNCPVCNAKMIKSL